MIITRMWICVALRYWVKSLKTTFGFCFGTPFFWGACVEMEMEVKVGGEGRGGRGRTTLSTTRLNESLGRVLFVSWLLRFV